MVNITINHTISFVQLEPLWTLSFNYGRALWDWWLAELTWKVIHAPEPMQDTSPLSIDKRTKWDMKWPIFVTWQVWQSFEVAHDTSFYLLTEEKKFTLRVAKAPEPVLDFSPLRGVFFYIILKCNSIMVVGINSFLLFF